MPRTLVSDRMGQIHSALIRFFFPLKPVINKQSGSTAPQVVGRPQDEIVDRVSDSDDIGKDVNFLRLAPPDVKQSFQQLVEQAKTRLGLVPKKEKDGSFRRKRKMTICHIRSMGLRSTLHFQIASDLIRRSRYGDAITEMTRISPHCFELAHDVALNSSHCWQELKCYNKALDQAIKCILIDERSVAGYFKTGRLLQHKKRFFEAEYCFRQALLYTAAGDMLTVYRIRKAMQQNVYSAILQSGYEESVAVTAYWLFRQLSRVAKELSSGEAFRQKHMWSTCSVSEPVFVGEDEEPLTEYDKRLKEMVGNY